MPLLHSTKKSQISGTFLFFYLAGRLALFVSVLGTLSLRASCLTLRLCLRIPLEGRLGLTLVFSMGVFT